MTAIRESNEIRDEEPKGEKKDSHARAAHIPKGCAAGSFAPGEILSSRCAAHLHL